MPSIHLVRHGEVDNPHHIVYADLPGYRLSARGRRQAAAAADRLASAPIAAVVTSPLERAVETAAILAAPHRLAPVADEALFEWRLGSRWAGTRWEDLPDRFPGELEHYLQQPDTIPAAPESLQDVGARVAAAVTRWRAQIPDGELVFVSHQDPIQAGRRALTGAGFAHFHQAKPGHASVLTLAPGPEPAGPWREVSSWEPDQGVRFPPLEESAGT